MQAVHVEQVASGGVGVITQVHGCATSVSRQREGRGTVPNFAACVGSSCVRGPRHARLAAVGEASEAAAIAVNCVDLSAGFLGFAPTRGRDACAIRGPTRKVSKWSPVRFRRRSPVAVISMSSDFS